MKTTQAGISVSILGKDFLVACPEDEKDSLIAAARHLDKQMRDIQNSGKVIGAERCAIMAALNIANDLLELQNNGAINRDMSQKLRFLQTKIDTALQS